jgi:hypothetical protein
MMCLYVHIGRFLCLAYTVIYGFFSSDIFKKNAYSPYKQPLSRHHIICTCSHWHVSKLDDLIFNCTTIYTAFGQFRLARTVESHCKLSVEDHNHSKVDNHISVQIIAINLLYTSLFSSATDTFVSTLPGFGSFQIRLLVLVEISFSCDAIEVGLLALIQSCVQLDWNLSNKAESLLTSVFFACEIFGMITLCPMADICG